MTVFKKFTLLLFAFCYLNSSSQWSIYAKFPYYTTGGPSYGLSHNMVFVNDYTGNICFETIYSPSSHDISIYRTNNDGLSWNNTYYKNYHGSTLDRIKGDTLLYSYQTSLGWNTDFIRSDDGGATWTSSIVFSAGAQGVYDVCFLNRNYGFYTNFSTSLVRVKNSIPATVYTFSTNVNHFYFKSYNEGFALVGNDLRATSDTGYTWTSIFNGGYALNKICFPSSNVGYISCSNGMVLKTINGGTNWTPINTGFSQNFRSISFKNDSAGFIIGGAGFVMRTFNGGATWIQDPFPNSNILSQVIAVNQRAYILDNQGTIYYKYIDTCVAPPSTSLILSEDTVCMTSAFGTTISLNGTPAGGTFSGPMGTTTNTVFTPNYLPGNYDLAYTYQDTKGCFGVSQATLMIRNCVGVNEQIYENESFVLYPNPTIGIINLNSNSENVKISLFNYLGEELLTKTLSENENSLNLTIYPSGIYFIRIYLKEDYSRTFKVIKE